MNARDLRNDPVLRRFRVAVEEAYGARLERVVLYGSRARGEARVESDYDVAVFLKGAGDLSPELDRLADIGTDILYNAGKVVHAMPFRAGSMERQTPFMLELRLDGIEF